MPMPKVPSQRPAPTSLTQPGARRGGSCPTCGSERLTSLSMILTDGTTAEFLSCHTCENRSWSADGRQLSFAEVLRRTTKTKVAAG